MMGDMRRLGWLIVLGTVGCHSAAPSAPAPGSKQYPLRGVVQSVNAAQQEISLTNEDMPGFMGPMTMEYKVTDAAAVGELHAGDKISATLLDDGPADASGAMRLVNVVVLSQAKPDYLPAVQYHVPAVGDAVPDFVLLNEAGKKVSLKQLRGKAVALTFIYTRCPLTDYCPRMTHNFAEMEKALEADRALYGKTHLLSVSFDPENDTPAVLKSYGAAYAGGGAETFAHWDFAAPSVKELQPMEQWFDVGVTPGGGGGLQHSLSTVVIGKDGKVVGYWPSNDWTVQDVLAKMKAAAG
jgi:protein SCO1/2